MSDLLDFYKKANVPADPTIPIHTLFGEMRNVIVRYLETLDTARRVQRASGNLGLDSHMQDLEEAEAALRKLIS